MHTQLLASCLLNAGLNSAGQNIVSLTACLGADFGMICLSACLSLACLSAVYLQVWCEHAQSSERHARPAMPGIGLSLWAVLQIFLLDMEGGYRGHASGQKWHEDLQWAHRLDEGWNLGAVKQV